MNWGNMRIFLIALICATCYGMSARATVLLYEPFAYPAGDTLDGVDGAAVNAGGKTSPNGNKWNPAGYSSQTSFNAFDGTELIDFNLSVPGLQNSTGNAVCYGGNGYSSRLAFATQTSGTVYSSFAFRIFDISGLT